MVEYGGIGWHRVTYGHIGWRLIDISGSSESDQDGIGHIGWYMVA